MKKNKSKPSEISNDAAPNIAIAPEALASLADKLKFDLAQPQKAVPSKGKSPRPKQEKSKKAPEKGISSNAQEGRSKQVTAPKRVVDDKAQKDKSNNLARLSNLGLIRPQTSEDRSQTQQPRFGKRDLKNNKTVKATQSAVKDGRKAAAVTTTPSKTKTQRNKEENNTPSLLEEILALGGTEEDLELIDGVNSDEDILGESGNSRAEKSNRKSGSDDAVYTLCLVLILVVSQRDTETIKVAWSFWKISG
jgi:hypothetical protein